MNSKKLNDLLKAARSGDYKKLQEVKEMASEEDYQKAVELFNQYGDKSEEEIMQELGKLRQIVPNQEEIIKSIKPFLNAEQLEKLDRVLNYLEEVEVEEE
ncbi:hypothetical protein Amet_3147 [Alkaliphilus metalliredigens QYMF]|uniref:PARP alpha-helical domain-containing protein n=1 Tax=Alkaliphilus metalliredigens (strain QYMF) TaxID=293826 RepID=A6TSW8_ALKMQ|nr:hypothetical protein [Alkaliphilus metalliredigens]ABR49286.1 hypothetical protein Amet_3147 [Alkaliphilus metalliredigens QYMF]